MTKLNDYLVSVTETKEILSVSYGQSAPANSNRIVISDSTSGGVNFGSVGVENIFCLADNSPIFSYDINRCPVYQDLIPRLHLNGGFQDRLTSTTNNDPLPGYPTQAYGPFTTRWYSGITQGATTGTGQFIFDFSSNITLLGTAPRYVTCNNGPCPFDAYVVTEYNTSTRHVAIQLNYPLTPSFSYEIGINLQLNTAAGTYRIDTLGVVTDGCYGVLSDTGFQEWTIAPTTTTTTTLPPTTSTTTTCNPTPNWQDTGITNCYGTCNLYYEQQDINPCSLSFGQTRQGPLYQENTTSCGGCCGQSTSPVWVNNGSTFCSGCTLYQPKRNDNPCYTGSPQNYNEPIGISDNCGSWNVEYYCTGCAYYSKEVNSCTNNVRNVTLINSNSTNCGGCCGQSTSPNWQNTGSYSCYGTCNKYNVQQDINTCSSSYGQTQQGSLVESNSSFCYIGGLNCCGQSTAPNWVNNGTAYCSACNLFQPQIDNNACSSSYNQTRNQDLGVNSQCGGWPTSYYCVGYDYYSKETNNCTGAVRNVTLVEANAYVCGYRDCSTWNIFAYNSDEWVYVTYTNCAGFTDYASFYASSSGFVGSVCSKNGFTPSITSGNGAASNTGSMCS